MTTNDITDIIIQSMADRQFSAFLTTYSRQCIDEADVFGVNKGGYMYEYEVKRSRSDFHAEFRNKKAKHRKLEKRDPLRRYNKWINGRRTDDMDEFIQIPNRYYFACPEGLILPDEVPVYAGLIYVSEEGEYQEIKKAPLLHRVKANQQIYEGIANVLSQRIIYGCSYYTYKHNKS